MPADGCALSSLPTDHSSTEAWFWLASMLRSVSRAARSRTDGRSSSRVLTE